MEKGVGVGDLEGDVYIPGIHFLGFLEQFEIVIEFSLAPANRGPEVSNVAVVRQGDCCQAKFLQRLFVIALPPIVIEAEREMAFAEVRIQLQRLLRLPLDQRLAVFGRIEPAINPRQRRGKPRMSERK